MPSKKFCEARKNKNDEFYTQRYDIEYELQHYVKHFKDKVVYCNCDDPEYSNFYTFFKDQFKWYGLKKIITTHYINQKTNKDKSYKIEIICKNGTLQEIKTPLKENGDFRSQECIELLKESDIVVTNPPFSLFKDFINQLVTYNKKFLIVGPKGAICYTKVFKLIKDNKLWLGFGFKNGTGKFINKFYDNLPKLFSAPVFWYTNLEHSKRNEELVLWETYSPKKFPKYTNYDAINVDKTIEIPKDYEGAMGVPISFLDKYNPNQFEIINIYNHDDRYKINNNINLEILKDGEPTGKFISSDHKGLLYLPYKKSKKKPSFKDEYGNLYQNIYARIIIKNKKVGV